jgi:hypothetical protein
MKKMKRNLISINQIVGIQGWKDRWWGANVHGLRVTPIMEKIEADLLYLLRSSQARGEVRKSDWLISLYSLNLVIEDRGIWFRWRREVPKYVLWGPYRRIALQIQTYNVAHVSSIHTKKGRCAAASHGENGWPRWDDRTSF